MAAYEKMNLIDGDILKAEHITHIEDGIVNVEANAVQSVADHDANTSAHGDIRRMVAKTVLFTEQTLTDEQKAQARTNIGAMEINPDTVYANGADYGEVGVWADGNPDGEVRLYRFVTLVGNGNKISISDSNDQIVGVTTDTTAFVGNARNYQESDPTTNIVGIIGVVPVKTSDSTIVAGDRVMSDDNGYAVKSSNNLGYRVLRVISEGLLEIVVSPNTDMVQRIRTDMVDVEGRIDGLNTGLTDVQAAMNEVVPEVTQLKDDIDKLNTADSSAVGKALKAKTVTEGKVTEWEFGETGDGSSEDISFVKSIVTDDIVSYLPKIYINQATGYIDADGNLVSDTEYKVDRYSVTAGTELRISASKDKETVYQWQRGFGVSSSNLVGDPVAEAIDEVVTVPAGATHLMLCHAVSNTASIVYTVKRQARAKSFASKTKFDELRDKYGDKVREINISDGSAIASTLQNRYRYFNPETNIGRFSSNRSFRDIGGKLLWLREGCTVWTNADSIYNDGNKIINNPYINSSGFFGCVLSSFINSESTGYCPIYGRETFDNTYVSAVIEQSGYYWLTWMDAGYDVHLYVYDPDALDITMISNRYYKITPDYTDCTNTSGDYILKSTGSFKRVTTNNRELKVTETITVSGKKGYSILVTGMPHNYGTDIGSAYATYWKDGNEYYSLYKKAVKNRYMLIPITDDSISVDIQFPARMSPEFTRFYIVPNEDLIFAGFIEYPALYGKTILAMGDSYVHGHTLNDGLCWYHLLAVYNCGRYIEHGHNGAGLVKSPNDAYPTLCRTVITELDDDADIYFIVCGRNDSSSNVPIGDYDDMYDPETMNKGTYNTTSSFMGGLNYIYNYVLNKHMDAKVIAVTPWSFTPIASITTGLKSLDYINAIKTISQKWGIPCYNAAGEAGIHVQNDAFRAKYFLSETDQSHLNADGHELMYANSVHHINELTK